MKGAVIWQVFPSNWMIRIEWFELNDSNWMIEWLIEWSFDKNQWLFLDYLKNLLRYVCISENIFCSTGLKSTEIAISVR